MADVFLGVVVIAAVLLAWVETLDRYVGDEEDGN